MVMTWNAEADAKLFLAVLNQLRDAKLKLDCDKIAQFMGPGCLPGAVNNRIVRLRRMAEAGSACNGSAGATASPAAPAATGTSGNDENGSDTPSPLKRKAVRKPRGAGVKGAKRAKAEAEEADGDADAEVVDDEMV